MCVCVFLSINSIGGLFHSNCIHTLSQLEPRSLCLEVLVAFLYMHEHCSVAHRLSEDPGVTHRLSEDPGVISVSGTTNYRLAEQPATDTPTTLEGPPGLTHPSSHDRSIESHDQRLTSHEKGIESRDRTLESHDQRLPLSAPASAEQLSLETLSPTAGKEGPALTSTLPATTETSVLSTPQPISLPSQQNTVSFVVLWSYSTSVRHTLTLSQHTHTHTQSTPGSYSVSAAPDLLMSHTSVSSSAHTSTPSTSHSGTAVSSKQGAVPPGMLYPHMMPQYPAAFMVSD